MNKVMISIAAQNCAGKTSFAEMLVKELGARRYSVRRIIEESAKTRGADISSRREFMNYSQLRKKLSGSEVFIKEALFDFYRRSDNVGVIESLRCVGEIDYLKISNYNPITIIPIGIIADREIRLKRFLARDTNENLVTTITNTAEFDIQEVLVNSGSAPWDENVSEVLKRIHFKIDNSDDDPEKLRKSVLTIKRIVQENY